MNSREKGKRAERMWRDVLRDNGFDARRGQQFSGSPDSPDVICEALPIHWEVKMDQALNVHKAIEQAYNDCPKGKWRVVAHKKNNKPWLVTMTSEDFMDLIKEWEERK